MKKINLVNQEELFKKHPLWPTHVNQSKFWEALGRTVGSFGYLEEILARSIFAITSTKKLTKNIDIEREFIKWQSYLLEAVSDTFYGLIKKFEKALQDHPEFNTPQTASLVIELRLLKEWRNVLCHCSWPPPDNEGRVIPFFVKNNGDIFETPVDIALLEKIANSTAVLTCEVINSVVSQGYDFPGSSKLKL